MDKELEQFLAFTTLTEKLKKIERFKSQFYWKDYPIRKRYESDADHSWRVALLVLLFENKLRKKFDTQKALKMALIHDLPEIIAGDESVFGKDGSGKNTHAYSQNKQKAKHIKEGKAIKQILSELPSTERKDFYNLWLEYEKRDSFEAKVVKALDQIECMLQVLEYRKGYMFPGHLEFTIKYGQKVCGIDPAVKNFAKLITENMKQRYREFKK